MHIEVSNSEENSTEPCVSCEGITEEVKDRLELRSTADTEKVMQAEPDRKVSRQTGSRADPS